MIVLGHATVVNFFVSLPRLGWVAAIARTSSSQPVRKPILALARLGFLSNSTKPVLRKALQDAERNAQTGMKSVVHVIAAVGIHNVDVIRVAPTNWPCIDEAERVATVLETPMSVVASVHMEMVPTAKTGGVMIVRNAAVLGSAVACAHGS